MWEIPSFVLPSVSSVKICLNIKKIQKCCRLFPYISVTGDNDFKLTASVCQGSLVGIFSALHASGHEF